MAGWVALALSPLSPRMADRVAGFFIPAVLSLSYTVLMLAFWAGAAGGYDSLANVMLLSTGPRSRLPAGCITSLSTFLSARGRCVPPGARRSRIFWSCPAWR